MRNLLLMSSSKAGNSEYLDHGKQWLNEHFGDKEVVFIPYAGVTMGHEAYSNRVAEALADTGIRIRGIETFTNPKTAIENAEGIAVGGGNTFVLLDLLYRKGLLDPLKRQIKAGVPYAGWSAGSNIAGLSIRTTNDMPIVQPPSFSALAAVNFQLNPHYIDTHPPGFHGETRAQRLAEFMVVNPGITTIGIREGTALKVQGTKMQLLGALNGVAFRDGQMVTIAAGKDCSTFL